MGVNSGDERLAILRSREIPGECKEYISHHVRNGLVCIMGAAMRIKDEPDVRRELEGYIEHITGDLKKLGL